MSQQPSEAHMALRNVSQDLEIGVDLLESRTTELFKETARFLTELYVKRADGQDQSYLELERDWDF
jgi:hypothetical protein